MIDLNKYRDVLQRLLGDVWQYQQDTADYQRFSCKAVHPFRGRPGIFAGAHHLHCDVLKLEGVFNEQ